jgi:hypothetical protein
MDHYGNNEMNGQGVQIGLNFIVRPNGAAVAPPPMNVSAPQIIKKTLNKKGIKKLRRNVTIYADDLEENQPNQLVCAPSESQELFAIVEIQQPNQEDDEPEHVQINNL